MSQDLLRNKVILIVGAGRSPAPALALTLAGRGAVIAANDLSPVLLDPLTTAIAEAGGQARSYIADATRGMPLRAMLDEVLEDWGRIDILINNPRIRPEAALFSMDEWEWQRTIEMNLNGPFLVTQLVARVMKEQGDGGIIFNLVDHNPAVLEAPGLAAYAASQQGLLALSQAAAREFIAYNIRVHTLCPDETLLNNSAQTGDPQVKPASLETATSNQALAELVITLCGSETAHQTGQIFRVSQTPTQGTGQQE
jgi:NAD(P)-dependent dehydrogenase (short-subunit alcohol dehydrogenase family)